jgi:hypothetical protein
MGVAFSAGVAGPLQALKRIGKTNSIIANLLIIVNIYKLA